MQFCNIAFREPLKNQNKEFVEALKKLSSNDTLCFSKETFYMQKSTNLKTFVFWNEYPYPTRAEVIDWAVEEKGMSLLEFLTECCYNPYLTECNNHIPDVIDINIKFYKKL